MGCPAESTNRTATRFWLSSASFYDKTPNDARPSPCATATGAMDPATGMPEGSKELRVASLSTIFTIETRPSNRSLRGVECD